MKSKNQNIPFWAAPPQRLGADDITPFEELTPQQQEGVRRFNEQRAARAAARDKAAAQVEALRAQAPDTSIWERRRWDRDIFTPAAHAFSQAGRAAERAQEALAAAQDELNAARAAAVLS